MHMTSLRFLITATGGITGTPPIPTFALLILGLYLTVSFKTMEVRPAAVSDDPGSMPRVRVLVVVPLMAVATAGTFLVAQIVIVGTTSYFFLKYFMGIELILAAWVPAVLGLILAARLPRRSGPAGVVAGVAGVLVASQSFGLFPGQDVGWQAHPGGTANVGSRQELTAAADGLFRAIDASTQRTAFDRDYVALGDQRGAKAYYPDAWFHAAWATSNNRAGTRYDILRVRLDGAVGAAPTVRKVLESDPRLDVLVAPDQVAELRAGLGDGPLADRVITWPVAPAAP